MVAIRKSAKRDAIYEALCSTKTHPTAEWIYLKLKPQIPDLSMGTVYRNLKQFQANGQAVCVTTVQGQERFDGDTAPHAHFICRICGDVQDLALQEMPKHPEIDASIERCNLSFTGVCPKCKAAE